MTPSQNDMHPVLLERYLLWKFRVNEELGLRTILTSVIRTNAEQTAFFAQHRNPLEVVNAYRRQAGMQPITEAENKYCVTWTMQSKHLLVNRITSRAFDFALFLPDKKIITWDIKWDLDHDGVPEYLECAAIAEECKLVSGAFWKNRDIPHVQLPEDVP